MAYAGHKHADAAAPRKGGRHAVARMAPRGRALVPVGAGTGFPVGADNLVPSRFVPRPVRPAGLVPVGAGAGLPIGADNAPPPRGFRIPVRMLPSTIVPVGAGGTGLPIGADNPAPFMSVPPQYALGDNGEEDYGQFGGISLKGIVKGIKKVASPVQKGLTKVGHAVGSAATSKVGQGILGAGLALTGIGAPAAAGIFAATKGVGSLIKPGGNIKHALTGAAQGAVEGVASVYAGKAVRAIGSKILNRGGGVASTATNVLEQQATGATPVGGDTAAIADAQRQIADAQAAAEAAKAEAARQVAEAQAANQAATAQGNNDAAAAYAAQVAQLQAQLAAAQAATQAAGAASQSANGSTDPSQLAALIDAAKKAAAASQAAAAAPPTPAATAAVQSAATDATDATQDAIAGAPAQAGIFDTLTSNPLLLVGGVAVAVLVFGKKKKRGRRAA